MNRKMTAAQLYRVEMMLTDRDRNILTTLKKLRYAKTDQLMRLFYPILTTRLAAICAINRNLNRLKEYGVIMHLPRQIGGVRGGSQTLVWHLTEQGARLLSLGTEYEGKRKRHLEPSPTFLRHTIAVSETYVQITELCRTVPNMKLIRADVEPMCWRGYEKAGRMVSLRPDLYADTVSDGYLYSWFIEVDLDTESTQMIVEKCKRYHEYYRTGKEQHATGVFPLVLWLVPTKERKQKIIESIREAFKDRYEHIFLIIVPQELHQILQAGVPEELVC